MVYFRGGKDQEQPWKDKKEAHHHARLRPEVPATQHRVQARGVRFPPLRRVSYRQPTIRAHTSHRESGKPLQPHHAGQQTEDRAPHHRFRPRV